MSKKGYWVARVTVHDPDTYKNYVAKSGAAFEKYGAKFLARGGETHMLLGQNRERNVIIEFPSVQAALDCFNSPEYAAARAEQKGRAAIDLMIVEGLDA